VSQIARAFSLSKLLGTRRIDADKRDGGATFDLISMSQISKYSRRGGRKEQVQR
jgi:hypothetical protein